ncbi:hypothetical protein B9Z55_001785 [Caenorhabditis nigoni]|uniref:Uncharacterized protein n=1 Tax=Caenorhabditis nigoni TaxID=1611254 RepID=A0A2G5VHL0_9PELO|nr:hypothetical protein B9Z55_001785 [Caenorhabditis nigoni]
MLFGKTCQFGLDRGFEMHFHSHSRIAVNPEDEIDVFFQQYPRNRCTSRDCYGYKVTINEEWPKFYDQNMLPSHIDQITIGGDVC